MPADSPLRILQICSASDAIYGAVQSLMTLARAQRDFGHHVEFITFKGKRFGGQVRGEGFTTHEVPVRAKVDPLAILHMRRLIREGRFDVVHTHLSTSSVNGCLAARAAKKPSVATVHGMSGRLSFAAATQMISVSAEIKRHLVKQGANPERVSVVYNGYDCDLSHQNQKRDYAFPVLGTVSRVTPKKGVEDAIRAIHRLVERFPDLTYIVVGDGDGLAACRELALALGLADRVKFTGYRKDIESFLSQMDLFVFPSLKEGMGIALVEAMAMGLATVATNVGGIPEVITPECGVLVPPHSPSNLAESIGNLLIDDPKRAAMGANAKARAISVFSVNGMRAATDDVYRSLLKAKR
ncbi:MAG: glycosyltransferase family 4 protein [Fimbriimonas sp.]|nr:glycosyltransferase family 4 protein [Fimbriimonas sp.]